MRICEVFDLDEGMIYATLQHGDGTVTCHTFSSREDMRDYLVKGSTDERDDIRSNSVGHVPYEDRADSTYIHDPRRLAVASHRSLLLH